MTQNAKLMLLEFGTIPDGWQPMNQMGEVTFSSSDDKVDVSCDIRSRQNKRFHRGESGQYGDVAVSGLTVFNSWMPDRVDGWYDSRYGLFVDVPAERLLPETLVEGQRLSLQFWCDETTGWCWRLVRSTPTAQQKNLVRECLQQAWSRLQRRSSLPLRSSPIEHVEIVDLPEWWSPPPAGTHRPEGLDLRVAGLWVGLDLGGNPLRLQISRLVSTWSDEGCLLRLVEQPATPTAGATYGMRLSLKDGSVEELWSKGEGRSKRTPNWQLGCRPARPEVVPASEDAAHPTPAPSPAEASDGAWFLHADEWLHFPVARWAANPASGETRRWSFGALLKSLAPHLDLSLWLDNSGDKELRISIGDDGEIGGVELLFTRPLLTARARSGFLPGSWLAEPSRPPAPDEERPWLAPGAWTLLAGDESMVGLTGEGEDTDQLVLEPKAARLRLKKAVHWQRSPHGLLGPVEWAINDRGATSQLSALRGLLPLQRTDVIVSFGVDGLQVDGEPATAFPESSVGARLLIVAPGTATAHTEVEITAPDQVRVRRRHSNPHLDATFVLPAIALARAGQGPVDARWTWASDRHLGEARSLETRTLLDDGAAAEVTPPEVPPDREQGSSTWTQTSMTPMTSFETALATGVWRQSPRRWSVRLRQHARSVFGTELRIEPLRVRDGNGAPLSVEFAVLPVDSHSPTSEVLRCRPLVAEVIHTVSDPTGGTLTGEVALPAEWLRSHHVEGPVQFPIAMGEVEIRFLGIVAGKPSVARDGDGDLVIDFTDVVYWFRVDGLNVRFRSPDRLTLERGTWKLSSGAASPDEPLLRIVDQSASFSVRHPIAPALVVEEHLLGGQGAGELRLVYGRNSIDLQVRTSYRRATSERAAAASAQPVTASPPPVAILRAGSYHLAWAGTLSPGALSPAAPIRLGAFELGDLARLFLHLRREPGTGSLRAMGIIGWTCAAMSLNDTTYRSTSGRATISATQPGQWNVLHVSGRWAFVGTRLKELPSAIVLARHRFLLAGDETEVRIASTEQRWILTEHAGSAAPSTIPCYQSLTVDEGGLLLRGSVLLSPSAVVAAMGGHTLRRGVIELRVMAERSARWAVDLPRESDGRPRSFRVLAPDAPEMGIVSIDDSVSRSELDPARDPPAVDRKPNATRGLTLLTDGTWLLCPVDRIADRLPDDTTPKLWIFEDDGETLFPLEGFLERLGSGPDRTAAELVACAEQTLLFLRWRRPAVLETWEERDGVHKVKWSVVDAPLLNIFAALDFMAGPVGILAASTQPDRARVWPAEHEMEPATEASDCIRFGEVEARRDDAGHPFVKARLAPIGAESVLSVRTGTPFENEGAEWDVTAVPWVPPTSASADAGTNRSSAVGALPPLTWRFACPRPGELFSVAVEAVAQAGAENSFAVSGGEATLRSRRAAVDEPIVLEPSRSEAAEHADPTQWPLRWQLHEAESEVRSGERLTVLTGLPGVRKLAAGTAWPMAVAWNPAADGPRECPYVVVLHCSSPAPFAISFDGEGRQIDPELERCEACWVLREESAFGKVIRVTVEHASQPVAVEVIVALCPDPSPASGFTVGGAEQFGAPQRSGSILVPNPRFEVVTDDSMEQLPPAPHFIGLLRAGRLLAYGPALMEVDVEFDTHRTTCTWVRLGSWTPPTTGWTGNPDVVVSIRPDGSTNVWRSAPASNDTPTGSPSAPDHPDTDERVM